MTKPELQASERAVKAAIEIRGLSSSPLPLDDLAQIIETTCHLKELEAVVSAARQWNLAAKSSTDSKEWIARKAMIEALKSLDAAKERK